jgi:ankyrin repeat protein
MLYLDRQIILNWGRGIVSPYVWLCKKDETLMEACMTRNMVGVRYHVEQCGADIHAYNDAAVRWTAEQGDLDIVKFLIEKSPSARARNVALWYAAMAGQMAIVEYLIECGADIHAYNDAALQYSIKGGHLHIAKFLIDKDPRIHIYNFTLRHAAMYGHLSIVEYAIEHGANIHAYNDAALRYSSMNCNLDIIKYLIDNGADIHANNDAALCMRVCVENDDIALIQYIIGHDTNDRVFSLSMYTNKKYSHLDTLHYLVEHGANIHADNEFALCVSAMGGKLDAVKYLVECGADIHVNHDMALRFSIQNSHKDVMEYLIKRGSTYPHQ